MSGESAGAREPVREKDASELSEPVRGDEGEWKVGDPIRFGGQDQRWNTARDGQAAGLQEQDERSSSSSSFRTSTVSTTAATLGSPSLSRPSAASSSSSSASWPTSQHRWDPPSPSLSSASAFSNGSTARFSLSRSYAQVTPPRPSQNQSQAVGLSQEELDDLVAGVDFEDTSSLLEDAALVSPSPTSRRQVAPEELYELLDGIDFSQEVELSDLSDAGGSDLEILSVDGAEEGEEAFFTAISRGPSPSAPTPPPSTRIIHRSSPSSTAARRPPPSSPKQGDLFSPAPTSPKQSFTLSPLRQSTSSRRAPSPPFLPPSSTSVPAPRRLYSSSSASSAAPLPKPAVPTKKPTTVIDLSNSPSSPPRPSTSASAFRRRTSPPRTSGWGRRASASSGDEVEVVQRTKSAAAAGQDKGKGKESETGKTADKPPPSTAGTGRPGWFQRPASFASRPIPAPPSASGSASSSSARPPSTASSSAPARPASNPYLPTARSSATTTSSRPLAPYNFKSHVLSATSTLPPPRKGSKRWKEDQKQALLREQWGEVFSYKTWAGKAKEEGGEVEVVCTTEERVVERVLAGMEGPLGFDLEWNPYVRNAATGVTEQGKTALVQVCDEKTVLLVQVARMSRFPPALKELIEDPNRIKLGVQIAGDANKLTRDFSHRPAGTLELNALVRRYDAQRFVGRTKPGLIGLQELTGLYLDCYLPKESAVRCGKWTGVLTREQIEYGANDVYASLQILVAIRNLAQEEISHADLVALSSRPYSDYYGFRDAPIHPTIPSASTGSTYALPTISSASSSADPAASSAAPAPSDPAHVLSRRKHEAFVLFHHEGLSPSSISARMSETGLPIKPVSVVWSLFEAYQKLSASGVQVEWDVKRLVKAADEVEWSGRMKEALGDLREELKKRAAELEGEE
ncbi:hypothetical protein JCM8097_005757 [Rhodosporidiobolus ruineniae]